MEVLYNLTLHKVVFDKLDELNLKYKDTKHQKNVEFATQLARLVYVVTIVYALYICYECEDAIGALIVLFFGPVFFIYNYLMNMKQKNVVIVKNYFIETDTDQTPLVLSNTPSLPQERTGRDFLEGLGTEQGLSRDNLTLPHKNHAVEQRYPALDDVFEKNQGDLLPPTYGSEFPLSKTPSAPYL
jgi:hypothetical protein